MGVPIEQTPQEAIFYTVNWPARGLAAGVTISSSAFTQSSSDFTLSNEQITASGTTTTFMLTGGIAGNFYTITNTILLSTTETWQETIVYVCIAERVV